MSFGIVAYALMLLRILDNLSRNSCILYQQNVFNNGILRSFKVPLKDIGWSRSLNQLAIGEEIYVSLVLLAADKYHNH